MTLTQPDHPDRDTAICHAYTHGQSIQQIADAFDLSRGRIYQILQTAGVWKPKEAPPSHGPRSFLAAHIPVDAKRALEQEAERQGKSVSQLTSEQIVAFLTERGYPINEK